MDMGLVRLEDYVEDILEDIDYMARYSNRTYTNSNLDVWQRFPFPVLEKLASDPGYYDLLRKKTHVIGKAGSTADMKIDDNTTSDSHAEISCIKKIVDGKVQLFLQVIDKNSKFGTFVKKKSEDDEDVRNWITPFNRNETARSPMFPLTGMLSANTIRLRNVLFTNILNNLEGNTFRRIESGQPILLSRGDSIRFGLNERGCFKFVSRDFFISKDDLNEADMKNFGQIIMNKPGLNFLSNSSRITHYATSNSVLKKAILGLATLKPIVTIHFFIDLCAALSPNSIFNLPFSEDYIPDLMENLKNLSSEPVSLDINPIRKNLFIGKKFYCSTKEQLLRVVDLISAAGGMAVYHTDSDNVSVDDMLNKNGYIFMQQDSSCTKPDEKYLLLLEKLKTMERRPILESEIALAVIFVSIEKYCNPHYNMPLVDFQFQSNETQSQVSAAVAPSFASLLPSLPYTPGPSSSISGSGVTGIKRSSELMDSHENLGPKKFASLEKK